MSDENANSPEEQPQNAPDAPESQDSPSASAEEAIDKVEQAADAVVEQATGDPESFNLPNFDAAASLGDHAAALGLLNDVDLKVTVELGQPSQAPRKLT